jgi:hypothetical protein
MLMQDNARFKLSAVEEEVTAGRKKDILFPASLCSASLCYS